MFLDDDDDDDDDDGDGDGDGDGDDDEVSKARHSACLMGKYGPIGCWPNKLRPSSSKSWLQSGRLRRGSLSWHCRFRTKPRQVNSLVLEGFGGPSGFPLAT